MLRYDCCKQSMNSETSCSLKFQCYPGLGRNTWAKIVVQYQMEKLDNRAPHTIPIFWAEKWWLLYPGDLPGWFFWWRQTQSCDSQGCEWKWGVMKLWRCFLFVGYGCWLMQLHHFKMLFRCMYLAAGAIHHLWTIAPARRLRPHLQQHRWQLQKLEQRERLQQVRLQGWS